MADMEFNGKKILGSSKNGYRQKSTCPYIDLYYNEVTFQDENGHEQIGVTVYTLDEDNNPTVLALCPYFECMRYEKSLGRNLNQFEHFVFKTDKELNKNFETYYFGMGDEDKRTYSLNLSPDFCEDKDNLNYVVYKAIRKGGPACVEVDSSMVTKASNSKNSDGNYVFVDIPSCGDPQDLSMSVKHNNCHRLMIERSRIYPTDWGTCLVNLGTFDDPCKVHGSKGSDDVIHGDVAVDKDGNPKKDKYGDTIYTRLNVGEAWLMYQKGARLTDLPANKMSILADNKEVLAAAKDINRPRVSEFVLNTLAETFDSIRPNPYGVGMSEDCMNRMEQKLMNQESEKINEAKRDSGIESKEPSKQSDIDAIFKDLNDGDEF